MIENENLIKIAYQAFNARDIDKTLSVMHPEVKWPKAFEGGYVAGHDEVRAYWTRQWQEISPTVTPVAFRQRPDGRLEVEVDQLVLDLAGKTLFDGKVLHVYTIENGLLSRWI